MSPALSPWLTHLWESSLFAGVCLGLILALDRLPVAGTRHVLAWLGLIKFFLPLGLLRNVALFDPWLDAAPPVLQAVQHPTWMPHVAATADLPSWPWWSIGLVGVWAAGVVLLCGWWFWQAGTMRQAIRRNAQSASASWEKDATRCWPGYPDRRPAICFAESTQTPAGVFGWLRPVIVVPTALQHSFDPAEREAFLRHEFQHVQRRDTLWLQVQIVLRNLLWMHPLSWWLEHRIRTERELIRDQEVIRKTNNPKSYLSCLMKASQLDLHPSRATSVCLNGSPFARRVKAIARASRSGVASILSSLASLAILAAFALFLVAAQSPALAGEKEGKAHYPKTDDDNIERQQAIEKTLKKADALKEKMGAISAELEDLYAVDRPQPDQVERQRYLLMQLGRLQERLANNERYLKKLLYSEKDHAEDRQEGERRDRDHIDDDD